MEDAEAGAAPPANPPPLPRHPQPKVPTSSAPWEPPLPHPQPGYLGSKGSRPWATGSASDITPSHHDALGSWGNPPHVVTKLEVRAGNQFIEPKRPGGGDSGLSAPGTWTATCPRSPLRCQVGVRGSWQPAKNRGPSSEVRMPVPLTPREVSLQEEVGEVAGVGEGSLHGWAFRAGNLDLCA